MEQPFPEDVETLSTSLSESNPLALCNLGFDELLALADAAWAQSSSLPVPGNDDGVKSLEVEQQHSIIHESSQDPQGTSCISCCTMTTSQGVQPIADNGLRAERRQGAAMQFNMKERDQRSNIRIVSAKNIDIHLPCSNEMQQHHNFALGNYHLQLGKSLETSDNACCSTALTPDDSIEAESREPPSTQVNMEGKDTGREEENVPAKKLETPPNEELCGPVGEFAAVSSPFKENHDPDKGSNQIMDINQTPPKKVRRETQDRTQKRTCVRMKGLNKTSAPLTEVTGEETLAREECSAVKENATAHLDKETGLVTQEMSASLAYDLDISMEQASNIYRLFAEGTHATNTSSGRNCDEANPKENPTAKRKRVRSGLKKSSTPTEVTGELIKEMMSKSAITSYRRSLNLDRVARDESSGEKNATVHLGQEIGVVMQEDVGLAYDVKTYMKQTSNESVADKSQNQSFLKRKKELIQPDQHVKFKRVNDPGKHVLQSFTEVQPEVCASCSKIHRSTDSCLEAKICYTCEQPGHIARNCPEASQEFIQLDQQVKFKRVDDPGKHVQSFTKIQPEVCASCSKTHRGQCLEGKGICYTCKQPGHIARNCPQASQELIQLDQQVKFKRVNDPGKHVQSFTKVQPEVCASCTKIHRGPCLEGTRICYTCEQPGHIAKNCPQASQELIHPNQQVEFKRVNDPGKYVQSFTKVQPEVCASCTKIHRGPCLEGTRICYTCKQPGHIARNCPLASQELNQPNQQVKFKRVNDPGKHVKSFTDVQLEVCASCSEIHRGPCWKGKGICYACEQPGHFARNCPQPTGFSRDHSWT